MTFSNEIFRQKLFLPTEVLNSNSKPNYLNHNNIIKYTIGINIVVIRQIIFAQTRFLYKMILYQCIQI